MSRHFGDAFRHFEDASPAKTTQAEKRHFEDANSSFRGRLLRHFEDANSSFRGRLWITYATQSICCAYFREA